VKVNGVYIVIPTNRPGQGGLPQNPNQPPRKPQGGLPSSPGNRQQGLPQDLPNQAQRRVRPESANQRQQGNQGGNLNRPQSPNQGQQQFDEGSKSQGLPSRLNYRDDGLPELSNENPLHSGSMSQNRKPARPRPIQNDRVVNSFDDPEDDTFSSIPVDEQIEETEYDPYDEEDARVRAEDAERKKLLEEARMRKAQREKEELDKLAEEEEESKQQAEALAAKQSQKKSNKSKKNKKDKTGQDIFIDEENLKLKPYGNPNRKSIKVNDFDERKNKSRNAAIVKYSVIGLLGGIFLLGLKSSFMPADQWTADEIQAEALAANNVTGFPIESGRGYAIDFMQAYLTDDKDKVGNSVLGYFYSGNFAPSNNEARYMNQSLRQKILYGPTIYSVTPLTDHSTSYVVGALVESSNSEAKAPSDDSASHWEFFNVNVYANPDTGALSITPDSPTVVPAAEVMAASDVPDANPIGTGSVDEELTKSLTSVVQGFMKGYATSSPTDHSALDQYIVSDAGSELKRGLDGQYDFAGGIESGLTFEAYPTEIPGEVKVKVGVRWANNIPGNKEIRSEYNSNYIMTLEKQDNDKYLVSKFAPEYFVASDALESE